MDESSAPETPIPTFEELAADPEIAALLEFEPAPRRNKRRDGWTPALQKRFIAHLARTGSPNKAADAVGKSRFGVEKVYHSAGAASFAAAWDAAVALFLEREAEQREAEHASRSGTRPPFADGRRSRAQPQTDIHGRRPLPGQVVNERGEWEDEVLFNRRGEEAKHSICGKLLRIRRIYLSQISRSPGRRAAFEILTELPVDWDKAERMEEQPDEPYRTANQHQPDMILLAESGWSFGDLGYGEDRKAKAREILNDIRVENGEEPIDWDAE